MMGSYRKFTLDTFVDVQVYERGLDRARRRQRTRSHGKIRSSPKINDVVGSDHDSSIRRSLPMLILCSSGFRLGLGGLAVFLAEENQKQRENNSDGGDGPTGAVGDDASQNEDWNGDPGSGLS
jgi:hypothetical protein